MENFNGNTDHSQPDHQPSHQPDHQPSHQPDRQPDRQPSHQRPHLLLPHASPSHQRPFRRLQLHLSSSLPTASSHNFSPRTPSLPSRLLLGQKYWSPGSRRSRPSRLNLSRNNSSLARPSSLNSRPELLCPHRGDPRWSTRCLTPAASSPRISQLHRTTGTVSTSPILPFCDCIYLDIFNISHR